MEKLETSYTLPMGMYVGIALLKGLAVLQKVKLRVNIWPSSSPRCTPKTNENISTQICTQIFIEALFITKKLGGGVEKGPSVGEWINKLEYSPATERTKYRCYNMDELWKHAKWKKPVILVKSDIEYNLIYIKYPE